MQLHHSFNQSLNQYLSWCCCTTATTRVTVVYWSWCSCNTATPLLQPVTIIYWGWCCCTTMLLIVHVLHTLVYLCFGCLYCIVFFCRIVLQQLPFLWQFQTTWYVEFQGTGVGGRLCMYLGLWLGCKHCECVNTQGSTLPPALLEPYCLRQRQPGHCGPQLWAWPFLCTSAASGSTLAAGHTHPLCGFVANLEGGRVEVMWSRGEDAALGV